MKDYQKEYKKAYAKPAKQNFYENTACQMIQSMEGVENFQKLPNHSTYVCNGSIIQTKELKIYPSLKTIDFQWQYKDCTIFCKYNKNIGGSQDNQIYKNSYEKAQNHPKQFGRNSRLLKNGKAGTTKMEHLASLCTRKVVACRMENLIEQLNSVCK